MPNKSSAEFHQLRDFVRGAFITTFQNISPTEMVDENFVVLIQHLWAQYHSNCIRNVYTAV